MGENLLRYIPKDIHPIKEYSLVRDIFGLPPLILEKISETHTLPPLRIIEKTSKWGNVYVEKRPISPNLPHNLYKKSVEYKLPPLLLLIFNYYLGSSSFIFLIKGKNNWPILLGKTRVEYFTHDLGEILLYREQALFLAAALTKYGNNFYQEFGVPQFTNNWLPTLVKGLNEKANILPSDPLQPSLWELRNLHC